METTEQSLKQKKLIPVFKGKAVDFYVSSEIWNLVNSDRQNLVDYLVEHKVKKRTFSNKDIWKKCNRTKAFLHIDRFKIVKNSKTKKPYIGSSLESRGITRQARRRRVMETNMCILRKMITGDINGEIVCAVTGTKLEGKTRYNPRTKTYLYNLKHYELHHVLTYNDSSVHKMSRRLNPGSMLQDYDLSEEKNKCYLLDLMGTIIVSQDEHKLCHDIDDYSDITYWKENGATLPWHIRNKDNFLQFCTEHNMIIDYETFLERHTLAWLEKNLDKIKELDHTKKEDKEEFWQRFQR